MKQKIFGIFSNIEDAKNAFGQIKKTSWNKADLTIVFSENQNKVNSSFEFAGEGFIDIASLEQVKWPGVKECQIEGIGKILVGFSTPRTTDFSQSEKDLIQKERDNQHLIGIIDVEPDILSKIQFIMESCGGEVLFNDAGPEVDF